MRKTPEISRYLTAVLAALAIGCGGVQDNVSAPIGRTPVTNGESPAELTGPAGLPAAKLVSLAVPDAPFVAARNGEHVAYAFVIDGKVYAGAGSQASTNTTPAELSKVTTLGAGFSLRAHQDGFLLFWDERLDQNHVFSFQKLDKDAKAVGKVVTLPPIAEGNLAFVDTLVREAEVALVYEVSKQDRLDVFAMRLGSTLTPAGSPSLVFERALGWHAATSAKGIVFAAVENDGTVAEASPALGSVTVRTLEWGGTLSPKVPVTKSLTAQIDVEIATLKNDTVVSWTDEDSEEGAVRVASIQADGSIKGPAWVAPPIGEQSLVALVADPRGDASRALVAWENVGQAVQGARVINLATVSGSLDLSKDRTRLLLSDADRPDIVADQTGFAALTLALPTVSDSADATARSLVTDRPWPTLVRFGADLGVTWSEPVRFAGTRASDGIPDAAWGLTCEGGRCGTIAADGEDPTAFFWAEAIGRESVWRAPAWRSEDERGPRVLALRTVMRGERVASAHSFQFPGVTEPSLGWVTYFQPGMTAEAPPRGEAPFAATLGVKGSPTAEGAVLSKRASSIGGIAVAPSVSRAKEEAIVLWVAEEKSGPQVYATRVDKAGKKVLQKKITVVTRTAKGASPSIASHVGIVEAPTKGKDGASGEGYVAAWVDSRDGNGEVYAARLSKDLEKSVVDKRLTTTKGSAADLTLVAHGSDVLMAFADSTEDAPTAASDIYFARVDAATLQRKDDIARVYASTGASRAPKLALFGSRIMLAWIEENPADNRGSLRIGEIDSSGRLLSVAKVVEAPDQGSMNGLAITCGGDGCRLVVSWSTPDGRLDMGGFRVATDGTPEAVVRLGTLSSGPFAEPSFSFADPAGTMLFFAEDLGDRGRVRQVELSWSR